MRKLTRADIRGPQQYAAIRDDLRKRVIELKRVRRVSVGPQVTIVFENRATMIFQVEEMCRAEQISTVEITNEQGDLSGMSATMRVGDAGIDVGFQPRDFSKGKGDPFAALAPTLSGMVEDARAAGVDLMFLTYPASGAMYGRASTIMRKVAGRG